jgi:nucleoside phosphorylase
MSQYTFIGMAHYLFPDEAPAFDAHACQLAGRWGAGRPTELLTAARSANIPDSFGVGRYDLWCDGSHALFAWRYGDTVLLAGVYPSPELTVTFDQLRSLGMKQSAEWQNWFGQGPIAPRPYVTSFIHILEYDRALPPRDAKSLWAEWPLTLARPTSRCRVRWSLLGDSGHLIVAPSESQAFLDWLFEDSFLPRLLLFHGKIERYRHELEACGLLANETRLNPAQHQWIERKLVNLKTAVKNFNAEWSRAGLPTTEVSTLAAFFQNRHQHWSKQGDTIVKVISETEMRDVKAPENSVDVVILTALDEERDAVLKYLNHVREVRAKGRIAHQADVGQQKVILLSMHGMGNVNSASVTQQAIAVWNPKVIVLVGITGGVEKPQERLLGDLLVPEVLVQYDCGKAKPEGFERRYEPYRVDRQLLDVAHSLKMSPQQWAFKIRTSRPDDPSGRRTLPTVHFGPVLSGQTVVSDSTLTSELLRDWPQMAGVEMEGIGTALAVYESETAPAFLMVKGISDWADPKKTDTLWRSYAAEAAAVFTVALLENQSAAPESLRPQAVRADRAQAFSGQTKVHVCRMLHIHWQDLADWFEIAHYHRAGFERGREPQAVWDWLEERGKLGGLDDALRALKLDHVADGLKT